MLLQGGQELQKYE
jgi:serine/threonine protein phosphatase PrpC